MGKIYQVKVLAIISRDLEKGSTKYRLAQYLEFLGSRGIHVEFVKRNSIDGSTIEKAVRVDAVFNQKCLFRRRVARKLIDKSRRTIFDLDDAIYTRPGRPHTLWTRFKVRRRLDLWLRHSDVITTSNHYLAVYARRYSDSIKVIPMAVDTNVWKPREDICRREIVVGWAGAPVNVPLIEKLDPVLTSLTQKYPFLKLTFFSGKKPRLTCPFTYEPFVPGTEPDFVKNLDIGLLPLMKDEFARGKSPIKAIQYLACGVPVVGNVIGATGEILNPLNSIAVSTDREWLQAVERLIIDRNLATSMGQKGRQWVEKNHNLELVAENLFSVFSSNDGVQSVRRP